MKLHTIIVSLWFMTSLTFASETKKDACPSGCGPVEHVFSKSIVKRYAEQNPNSGLVYNDDTENVPTNIITAAITFGLHATLTDDTGNPIIPQPFSDGQGMFLPLFKSKDIQLRKSIVATTEMDDSSSSEQILERWEYQYNLSKTSTTKYNIMNISVTENGIVICPACTLKGKK